MNEQAKQSAELWAIVEVMGHSHYAGRVSEFTDLGTPLIRVEIPAVGDLPAFEKLLGGASIFRITPCTEDVARRAAEQFHVRPLELVYLPSAEPARLSAEEDLDDDRAPDYYGDDADDQQG